MSAKFIFSRKLSNSGMTELVSLPKKLRSLAGHQPDYLSGESFKRGGTPGKGLIINTRYSVEDWSKWVKN